MSEKKYENELFVKLIEDEFGAKKVVVCPLELALVPGPVCWKRDPDSPFKFDFKDLQIASPPFEIIEKTSGMICVENNAHYTLYWYTIVVEVGSHIYDTLQPTCEDSYQIAVCSVSGDKPVIRPR